VLSSVKLGIWPTKTRSAAWYLSKVQFVAPFKLGLLLSGWFMSLDIRKVWRLGSRHSFPPPTVTGWSHSGGRGGRLNRGGRKVCKDCRQVCKCVQLPDKMNSTCSEQGQSTLLPNMKKFVSTTRILSILTRPRTMGTVPSLAAHLGAKFCSRRMVITYIYIYTERESDRR